MSPDVKVWLGIGAGVGVGVALYLIKRSGDVDAQAGSIIDQIGDAVSTLTTSEEGRISQLEPSTQAAARSLVADLASNGIGTHVGQTLRTSAQEKAVANLGAVKTVSWHQLGRALDIYPLFDDGTVDLTGNNLDAIRMIAETAERYGFRQLAFKSDGSKYIIHNSDGKPIWDSGHIEYRAPYATIADAVAAEGAAFGLA